MLRYLFYRLYEIQNRRLNDSFEAAMTAIVYLSLSPTVLMVSADILSSHLLDTSPIVQYIGKWTFTGAVYSMVYLCFYLVFVRKNKAKLIADEFKHSGQFSRLGNYIFGLYFILPLAVMFYVAGRFAIK